MQVCGLYPSGLRRLFDPSIRTVFLAGCGGGFDFVHSLLLYHSLHAAGKVIVLGSYSFVDVTSYGTDFWHGSGKSGVIRVTAQTPSSSVDEEYSSYYAPEKHVASYLDCACPENAPHCVYAYGARNFSPTMLADVYNRIIDVHQVDAVVLIDGGSDSLMRGDESGLGDPVEDAVSVCTVAHLLKPAENARSPLLRMMFTVGLGVDRFNDVSDAASLRAIAEISRDGGFLGSFSIERGSLDFMFYRDAVEHIYAQQRFRSVVTGAILGSSEGYYGSELPTWLLSERRVQAGDLFLWPLTAMVWMFDVDAVARRSLVAEWVRNAASYLDCTAEVDRQLRLLREAGSIRSIENLPLHEDYSQACIMDRAMKDAAAALSTRSPNKNSKSSGKDSKCECM
jgi:hypothetical protein